MHLSICHTKIIRLTGFVQTFMSECFSLDVGPVAEEGLMLMVIWLKWKCVK